MMDQFQVETILKTMPTYDGVSYEDNFLATVKVVCPRYLWMEILTHRRFARNASSSRAMRGSKIITDLGFYIPPVFYGQGKGMVAGEELDGPAQISVKKKYEEILSGITGGITNLMEMGLCKEQANRLFPTNVNIAGLITGTKSSWESFFLLRINPNADKSMQELAYQMWSVIYKQIGWKFSNTHTPYVDDSIRYSSSYLDICAARCARISYGSGKGSRSDVDLAKELIQNGHLSPFEHIATWKPYPRPSALYCKRSDGIEEMGWETYRNVLEDQISKDGHE